MVVGVFSVSVQGVNRKTYYALTGKHRRRFTRTDKHAQVEHLLLLHIKDSRLQLGIVICY